MDQDCHDDFVSADVELRIDEDYKGARLVAVSEDGFCCIACLLKTMGNFIADRMIEIKTKRHRESMN